MHRDELKGTLEQAAGKVQSAFGRAADSPYDEAEGDRKQAEGTVDKVVGKVKDTLHKAID